MKSPTVPHHSGEKKGGKEKRISGNYEERKDNINHTTIDNYI